MITRLKDDGFPVAVVCRALGVSRAGYYAHARAEIREYPCYYDTKRRHSALDYLTPCEFELAKI